MKRIILGFDGTWDVPASGTVPADQRVESNVARFHESIAKVGRDGVEQLAWYNRGVGTDGFDHLAGGVFGFGLDAHILEGYRFLVNNYQDGDEVYLLGFSRGAYTARSLVGLIRNCGLVRPSFADVWIGMAYGIYRCRDDGPDSRAATAFRSRCSRALRIKFVGVWDTVGALGIPLELARHLNAAIYEFHDTKLSSIVERAYQAAALDEHRHQFDITLWDPPAPLAGQQMEQRWFVGSHGNVGGGEVDRRLSDLTLRWMQDHAAEAGLTLAPVAPAADGYAGTIDDSYKVFLDGTYARMYPPFYRPVLRTPHGNEVLDPTIRRRQDDPAAAYAPRNPGLAVRTG